MKKLAAWSWWLDGCIWGVALAWGTVQAAPPPDMVIATADEALGFSDPEPFVFAGQSLSLLTSFSTERDIRLERLAPLIVGPGVQFEIQGQVASAGLPLRAPLEKRGLGTLTLAGANSYTSNTVLREGVLRLHGTSALGDSLYNLEQHGGTILHLDAGSRLDNFIQLVAARPGDMALPGLEETVQWRVDAGTATLSNNINALLPVSKTGAGSLRLTGIVQGHSNLLVEAGALVVDSLAAARVAVADGARLEGQGELAHLHLHTGGMVAPGGRDRPATLSVWGDAMFEAGSFYHVNAYPDGRADRLHVSGVAVLDGRVLAQAGDGDWAPEHRYLILSADGGLKGSAFSGVDTDLAFLDPALEYDEDRVYLMLRRNDLEAGDIGETVEEKEVGDAITPPERRPRPRPPRPPRETAPTPEPAETAPEAEEPATPEPEQPDTASQTRQEPLPLTPEHVTAPAQPLTPLQEAMQGMSTEQLRTLLRRSSGSWHASVRSFLLKDSRHVRQALLASGRDAHARPGWQRYATEGLYGSVPQAGSAAGWRSWAQSYAAGGRRAAAAAVAGDRHESRGIVLGLDAPAARHWRLGMALAAQQAQLKQGGWQALAKVESLHAGFSAHADWSGMRLTTALLRTWHRIDSRRRVSAGPLQELQRSTYAGRSWQAVMELAPHLRSLYKWGQWLRNGLNHTAKPERAPLPESQAPGWRMAPYVRHEWQRLRLPRHQESGGLLVHEVAPSSTTIHATTLGWRLRYDWPETARSSWLETDLGWRRLWGDARVSSSQRFVAAAGPGAPSTFFSSQGQPLARSALALTLEAGLAPRRNVRLALRYAGLAGSGYHDHAAWADLRWMF